MGWGGVGGWICGSQRTASGESVLSFIMWVPNTELSSSGLTANLFTRLAILQTPMASFIINLNVSCYIPVLQISRAIQGCIP